MNTVARRESDPYIQCWFKIMNSCFNIIKKFMNKIDNLVNEMLSVQDLKPALNVQSGFLRAKVFI